MSNENHGFGELKIAQDFIKVQPLTPPKAFAYYIKCSYTNGITHYTVEADKSNVKNEVSIIEEEYDG